MSNKRFQRIYGNDTIQDEIRLPDVPYRCPICGDCFDDLGNLIENPEDWEPSKEFCDTCKAADIYEALTRLNCESYYNMYNFYKGNSKDQMPKFWVWMATSLKTEIHIAKMVMILIIDDQKPNLLDRQFFPQSDLWKTINETFSIKV